jgi:hypothetical protein
VFTIRSKSAIVSAEPAKSFPRASSALLALLRGAICTLEGEIAEAQPIVESVKSQSVKESVQESKATQKEDEVRSLQPSLWGGIDLKAAWRRMGRWWPGQASAVDSRAIPAGRDVGGVVVQRQIKGALVDVPYDVPFAFAFHAFRGDSPIHSTKRPDPPK